jgi:hypothetical protein
MLTSKTDLRYYIASWNPRVIVGSGLILKLALTVCMGVHLEFFLLFFEVHEAKLSMIVPPSLSLTIFHYVGDTPAPGSISTRVPPSLLLLRLDSKRDYFPLILKTNSLPHFFIPHSSTSGTILSNSNITYPGCHIYIPGIAFPPYVLSINNKIQFFSKRN